MMKIDLDQYNSLLGQIKSLFENNQDKPIDMDKIQFDSGNNNAINEMNEKLTELEKELGKNTSGLNGLKTQVDGLDFLKKPSLIILNSFQ